MPLTTHGKTFPCAVGRAPCTVLGLASPSHQPAQFSQPRSKAKRQGRLGEIQGWPRPHNRKGQCGHQPGSKTCTFLLHHKSSGGGYWLLLRTSPGEDHHHAHSRFSAFPGRHEDNLPRIEQILSSQSTPPNRLGKGRRCELTSISLAFCKSML